MHVNGFIELQGKKKKNSANFSCGPGFSEKSQEAFHVYFLSFAH